MKRYTKLIFFFVLLVALTLALASCNGGNAAVNGNEPEVEDTTDDTAEDGGETSIDADRAVAVPFLEAWQSSGHNEVDAEAFNHWNEGEDGADPAVAASCAKCHSTPGFEDFLGLDGSEFGSVEADAEIGTTVECAACHNDVTVAMTSVVMPSGLEITDLGDESRCMQCHQGRSSKFTVDEATLDMEEDTVNEELGFINIHYYAAAATKYGTEAKGGYEYEGSTYDAFFTHVEGVSACIDCHDPHTLEIQIDVCMNCHEVEDVEGLKDVRMESSAVDYDGDGDVEEGVYYEIEGLQEQLYAAMQAYAADNGGAIAYNSHAYPYFFADLNEDGEAGDDEANYGNKYSAWTPRLLKAAYNYQVSLKDPGAFAHGGKYIIQLLHDSIEDLGAEVGELRRIDHGHFAGSEEAFRHWDEDGEVPASCSRCHSAEGVPLYLEEGVSIAQEPTNGLLCSTCHNGAEWPARYAVTSVEFPSGLSVSLAEGEETDDAFLCMTCHQGRESKASVDSYLASRATGDDVVMENAGFRNIHYFPAGATRYGADAQAGYEYDGKSYVGYFLHVDPADSCVECHDAHELEVQTEQCATCHGTEEVEAIRDTDTPDYDGDGDVEEGLAGEVETLAEALYAEIQAYAAANGGADAIVYDSHSYPYFFIDTDGDGVSGGPSEANYGNRYVTWTPSLLKAAYNYQYSQKDPGAFAHNGKYLIQVLIDSIADLGGSVSDYTRP